MMTAKVITLGCKVNQYESEAMLSSLLQHGFAAAEDEARRSGARAITLHAQANKQGFYERCGYAVSGPRDLDEGVPHVWMSKQLGTAGEPR